MDEEKKFKKWKGINRKQSTRWQHLFRLKASAFLSLQFFLSCYEAQQLIFGTGTAIWWVTEPHKKKLFYSPLMAGINKLECFSMAVLFMLA
jgi:hypothetical protein